MRFNLCFDPFLTALFLFITSLVQSKNGIANTPANTVLCYMYLNQGAAQTFGTPSLPVVSLLPNSLLVHVSHAPNACYITYTVPATTPHYSLTSADGIDTVMPLILGGLILT